MTTEGNFFHDFHDKHIFWVRQKQTFFITFISQWKSIKQTYFPEQIISKLFGGGGATIKNRLFSKHLLPPPPHKNQMVAPLGLATTQWKYSTQILVWGIWIV